MVDDSLITKTGVCPPCILKMDRGSEEDSRTDYGFTAADRVTICPFLELVIHLPTASDIGPERIGLNSFATARLPLPPLPSQLYTMEDEAAEIELVSSR